MGGCGLWWRATQLLFAGWLAVWETLNEREVGGERMGGPKSG